LKTAGPLFCIDTKGGRGGDCDMAKNPQSELQQEIVNTFIDTKAVNFEAIGSIIGKFGSRAAKSGTDLSVIINRYNFWACGWPGPDIGRLSIDANKPNG
jgi:hypothetical protein